MQSITLIAAMATPSRCIGINNKLPWHLPDDFNFFKKMTHGKWVLMGRKTFDSIGKPLPNRNIIILTRQKNLKIPGCHVINSTDELSNIIPENEELMIAGGEEIYNKFIPLAQKIYLTEINCDIKGDTFFPELDNSWKEITREHHMQNFNHKHSFDFVLYHKVC